MASLFVFRWGVAPGCAVSLLYGFPRGVFLWRVGCSHWVGGSSSVRQYTLSCRFISPCLVGSGVLVAFGFGVLGGLDCCSCCLSSCLSFRHTPCLVPALCCVRVVSASAGAMVNTDLCPCCVSLVGVLLAVRRVVVLLVVLLVVVVSSYTLSCRSVRLVVLFVVSSCLSSFRHTPCLVGSAVG